MTKPRNLVMLRSIQIIVRLSFGTFSNAIQVNLKPWIHLELRTLVKESAHWKGYCFDYALDE